MDQEKKRAKTCSDFKKKKEGESSRGGTCAGKRGRKRQEFLAYQNSDPLSQWWMSKASSDLSLLLICLARALFSAEQGWTLEHVTPVAARPNPLTSDSWACRPERGLLTTDPYSCRYTNPTGRHLSPNALSIVCFPFFIPFVIFPGLLKTPRGKAQSAVR